MRSSRLRLPLLLLASTCFSTLSPAESLEHMLIEAAKSSDMPAAQEALMRGVRLNYQELETGETPLLNAVIKRDLPMIEMLLRYGASPNLPNRKGELPIMFVFDDPDTKVAAALVRAGAYVPNVNIGKENIVLVAIRKGRFDLAKLLIEQGHGDIRQRDEGGNTLAMAAVIYAMEYPYREDEVAEFITWLRTHGLSMELQNTAKQTVIDLALASGRPAIVIAADWRGLNRGTISEMQPLTIEEKLAMAIEKQDFISVLKILAKVPDISAAEQKLNTSLVCLAVETSNLEMLELLLKKRANPNARDAHGVNPLMIAVKKNDFRAAATLVQAGADPTALDQTQACALFVACAMGKVDFVKLFADSGANLNTINEHGLTSLMCSVYSGNVELARYLISKGVDPSLQNAKGQTAADLAVAAGELDMVRFLDSEGAHAGFIKEFAPAAGAPYFGAWISVGEYEGQLRITLKEDGTGLFEVAGDETGRIAWKTRYDMTAELHIKRGNQRVMIPLAFDYGKTQIVLNNDGTLVWLRKVDPAEIASPSPTPAPAEPAPALRVKEEADPGDRSNRRLIKMPPDLLQDPKLERVDLSYNKLTSVEGIRALPRVTALNLKNNRIAELPEEISYLRNLRDLDASDNWLKQLPSRMGELVRLRVLNLSDNNLSSLPGSFWKCNDLETLNLGSNQFAEFPTVILDMPSLRTLNLRNNQIAAIPSTIPKLVRLVDLDLSYNKLTQVPKELKELPYLKIVRLQGNPIDAQQKKIIAQWLPKVTLQFGEEEFVAPKAKPVQFVIKNKGKNNQQAPQTLPGLPVN